MTTVAVHPVPDTSLFLPDLKLKRKESVLHEMACVAQKAGAVRDAELLHETLLRRERWGPSAGGKGGAGPDPPSLAVPGARSCLSRGGAARGGRARGCRWGWVRAAGARVPGPLRPPPRPALAGGGRAAHGGRGAPPPPLRARNAFLLRRGHGRTAPRGRAPV